MLLSIGKLSWTFGYIVYITKIIYNLQQIYSENAAVVKLADALDSKSSGLILRVGSSPTSGTKNEKHHQVLFIFSVLVKGREPKVRA